ncbi:MAG: acyltransferase [Lachnospiraceae bacterium]|nr:acyltransferase [Lachnospiraceae bacterium]
MTEINERNYGIDLLRFVAMVYIVVLHTLGHGGVLYSVIPQTQQYYVVWFLEIWAYCAVDVFAMISGFASAKHANESWNIKRYLYLWLKVVFYSVLLYFVVLEYSNNRNIDFDAPDFIDLFFPVSNGTYWYFSQYTILFFVAPLLHRGFDNVEKKELISVVVILFFCFSVIETINGRFAVKGGYNATWLIFCYTVGFTVSKYSIGKYSNRGLLILLIIILNTVTWFLKIKDVKIVFLGNKMNGDTLISYTSPTICLISILYLIFFLQVKIKNNVIIKVIKYMAPSVFSIYLINDNPCIRTMFLKNKFLNWTNYNFIVLMINVVIFALIFSFVAIFVDRIVMKLFFLLKQVYNKFLIRVNRGGKLY